MWISDARPPGFPPSRIDSHAGLQAVPTGFIVTITRKATEPSANPEGGIMTMGESVAVGERDRGRRGVATLPVHKVVSMFRNGDLVTYGDARREFFIQVNLNPFRTRTRAFHERMEDAFAQWFSFDYHLDISGLTPFAVAAAVERDGHCGRDGVGESAYRDLCETSSSNFASWFWVRGASAVSGEVVVEDLAHGGMYEVQDRALAGRFDGATGGTVIGRIAEVRGVWRMPWATLYEAHTPCDDMFRVHVASSLHEWDPGYADYARLLFGRDPRLNVDWEDMAREGAPHPL